VHGKAVLVVLVDDDDEDVVDEEVAIADVAVVC